MRLKKSFHSPRSRARRQLPASVPRLLRSSIEWLPIERLRPFEKNARMHSPRQIEQLAASIRAFGFTNPVLIDETGMILAGHGRVAAAKRLGLQEVPSVRLGSLNEAQKRAYVLADNKLAELSNWDEAILAIELQHLLELDFEVELTGFSTAEIDILIDGSRASGAADAADEIPSSEFEKAPISRLGDLWALGAHRLLCGDAANPESYKRLLAGDIAELVFIDPPYNVPIHGHVSGTGRVRHREFAMAVGELSPQQFTEFLSSVFRQLVTHSVNGSIHYICMDWRHVAELLAAARENYTEQKNLAIWVKSNAGLGTFYRSRHELIFVFKSGTKPHINNFGLGENGRYRTNVWEYAGVNTFRSGRMTELSDHPTPKPIELVADAVRDCSRRNGLVLDAFAGSGSTLIAAERTGRRGYALELDPIYVDVAVRRWERFTGNRAQHIESGLSLADLARERSKASGGRKTR